MSILGFQGEYRWLSNMQEIEPFTYYCTPRGIVFDTTENFYQAMKTKDVKLRKYLAGVSPYAAKKAARDIYIREGWESIKLQVMLYCNKIKYSQPKFRELLLGTGDCYIEETNGWGDTFWGVYEGEGENNLGKIIMQIREEING